MNWFSTRWAPMRGAVVVAVATIIACNRPAPVFVTISIAGLFAALWKFAFVRRAQKQFADPLHAADAVWYFDAASVLFAVRSAGAAPPVAFFAFVLSAIVAARLFGAAVQFAGYLGLATVGFAEFHGFAWESAVLVRASMFLAALVPSPHVAARDFVLQDHATVHFAVQATLHEASFAFRLGAGMVLAMLALGSLRSTRHMFCSFVIR